MERHSDSQPAFWWTSPRRLLRAILMLDDTPHSIALGTAIGVFVSFTPTVGAQMVIVLIVAALTGWLFRFNRIAALLAVYISNPLTVVPIYWFDYQVGCLFFPATVSHDSFAKILQYNTFGEWWATITALFVEIGAPLVVGSLIVASLFATATYPATLRLIGTVRHKPSQSTEPQPAEESEPTEVQKPVVSEKREKVAEPSVS